MINSFYFTIRWFIRSSSSIRARRRRSTVACRRYHRHRLYCSTLAPANCQHRRVVFTEHSRWIRVHRHSRSSHRIRRYRVLLISKTCIFNNHHLDRPHMQAMHRLRICIRTICHRTESPRLPRRLLDRIDV